jgi:hypothetical protein
MAEFFWVKARTAHIDLGECELMERRQAEAFERRYAGPSRADDAEILEEVGRRAAEGWWIVCGCNGDDNPPAIAPVRYAGGEELKVGYRRLIKRGRHAATCEVGVGLMTEEAEELDGRRPKPHRSRLFAALRPRRTRSPRAAPTATLNAVSRGRSTPTAAILLWRLMEEARLNVLVSEPPVNRNRLCDELRRAAAAFSVARGVPLRDLLFTDISGLAKAEAAIKSQTWPERAEPQAFMVLLADSVDEHGFVTREGRVDVVQPPKGLSVHGMAISGPFLVLAVLGRGDDGAVHALEAFAQPVKSLHRVAPVDSDMERRAADAFEGFLRDQVRQDRLIQVTKPLFTIDCDGTACLPDFLVEVEDPVSSRRNGFVVEVMGMGKYPASKREKHAAMAARWGRVISIDGRDLDGGFDHIIRRLGRVCDHLLAGRSGLAGAALEERV